MNVYRAAARLVEAVPDTVKQKLCGVLIILVGIASAVISRENGIYDITAAIILEPLGFVQLFSKQ